MSRVREVTPRVLDILKKHPETRSNDRELIVMVYDSYGADINAPFWQVIEDMNLPSIESIRRARQKIQNYCEDLRAEEPVESIRIAEQEDYIEYSREEIAI